MMFEEVLAIGKSLTLRDRIAETAICPRDQCCFNLFVIHENIFQPLDFLLLRVRSKVFNKMTPKNISDDQYCDIQFVDKLIRPLAMLEG